MSTAQTLLLGAVAGCTIFVGLPVARLRNVPPNVRGMLAALATGILIFLLWDVLTNAVKPVESALTGGRDGRFAWLATLLAVGFAAGLLTLVYYDGWMKARRRKAFLGPGAASTAEFEHEHHFHGLSPARWLAIFIASGIGLHNFSEGLAIGQSAAGGELTLALVLIIGFGLHNATEGFGICGPLSGAGIVPSWRLLGLLGLIGGSPTFLGTVVGQAWASDAVSVVFFTVAGGSILYVVRELFAVNRKYGHPVLVNWLLLAGILLGFATDFVVTAAGV